MKIEHIAIWVNDLERMKDFYCRHFEGKSNQKYTNPQKGFESYFITFYSGARLELMHSIKHYSPQNTSNHLGYAHIAFSVGSREQVELLINRLRMEGYDVIGDPRVTGDGYYEGIILDPEGNTVEITV